MGAFIWKMMEKMSQFLLIMLNCPPVKSLHNSSVSFRVHASVTFLVNEDERQLLMVCFFKRLETCPFHWRRFCRYVISRLGNAFPRIQNIFTNGTLISKIYSAYSFADAMYSSGNIGETFFFCFVSFAHAQSTSKCKSAYFCHSCMCTVSKSGFSKFWHKSFGYSRKKSERLCLFLVVFY